MTPKKGTLLDVFFPRGRPRVAPSGQARSVELRVRVTPTEARVLRDDAEAAGVSVSEHVRAALGLHDAPG